jgi:hypothetical protein
MVDHVYHFASPSSIIISSSVGVGSGPLGRIRCVGNGHWGRLSDDRPELLSADGDVLRDVDFLKSEEGIAYSTWGRYKPLRERLYGGRRFVRAQIAFNFLG